MPQRGDTMMEEASTEREQVRGEAVDELDSWVITAWGKEASRRFEAPVQIEGWKCRPWVEVRPLTHRESLERESIGIRDEYTVEGYFGDRWRVTRRYDLAAMREYEYEHCVIDYLLPEKDEEGRIIAQRGGAEAGKEIRRLLERLPKGLGEWLDECIDKVNLRTAGQSAALEEVKKSC